MSIEFTVKTTFYVTVGTTRYLGAGGATVRGFVNRRRFEHYQLQEVLEAAKLLRMSHRAEVHVFRETLQEVSF